MNIARLKDHAFINYFRQSYAELKKVTWPSKELIRRHTILVIGISFFIAMYFAVVDYLLNLGLQKLISL